ncbi:MAG: ABC transporter ATP-binding protein, partial [Chloroflexi bacterium]|nr:ABC transporter ATP-binding protein [Chloroflexota bacterium]
MSVLEVRGMGVALGGRPVLREVSLAVAAGEVVGVVGPNGSGKTTLLRAIAGGVPHTGAVTIGGTDAARLAPRDLARVVAQVPQSTEIDFAFSCLEVVLMGRHPHLGRFESEGARDHGLARDAMARTDTAHLAERAVNRVSGGER